MSDAKDRCPQAMGNRRGVAAVKPHLRGRGGGGSYTPPGTKRPTIEKTSIHNMPIFGKKVTYAFDAEHLDLVAEVVMHAVIEVQRLEHRFDPRAAFVCASNMRSISISGIKTISLC